MSVKHVHNLRREARRLQVRLELSNALLADAVSWKAMRTVTSQLRALGPLRDSQVQLKLLQKMEPKVPELQLLRRYLKRRRRRIARTVRRLIKRRNLGERILALQKNLVACPGGAAVEQRRRFLIRRAVFASRKLATANLAKAKAGCFDLHRARIALKHYALISDVVPSLRTGAIENERANLLRRVAMLGNVHDLDVLQARIANAARKHLVTKKVRIVLRDTVADRRAAAFGVLDSG